MIFYEEREKYQIYPNRLLNEAQLDGIDFVLHKFNCILNLKPGAGKTSVGIIASYKIMLKTNDTITFVVCPKQANTAFKKEFKGMGIRYSIITTEEKEIDNKCRYFIFNYSNVDDMIDLLTKLKQRNFRVIGLFDEIHMLGSSDSSLVNKMKSVRNLFTCVIGMTGTPLLNHIEGLYNVVNFTKPGFLGTWYDFKRNWVVTKKRNIRVKGRTRQIEEIVGYNNLDGLKSLLENIIITRGIKYPLRFFYRECSLLEDEKEYYENAAKGILDREECDDEKAMSGRLWDLQKVADGSSMYLEGDRLYSKNKLMISVIKEILSRGEGVLIYTEIEDTYKNIGSIIEKYKGYLGYSRLWYITGKVPYKKRVECEKSLRPKDIVIVTKAGNKSINLQAVNNVIFYNLPFALGDYIQMCPEVDEYVTTDKGNIRAKYLEDSFNVIRNGKTYKAYVRGTQKKKVFNVTLSNGMQVKVSQGHKFLTSTGEWVKVEDSLGRFLELDLTKTDNVSNTSKELWYLIGYLYGDGTTNHKNTTYNGWNKRRREYRWLIPKSQRDYKEKIKYCLEYMGMKYTETECKESSVDYINVYGDKFGTILENIGYRFDKSGIPEIIFCESEDNKREFLQGLYDSDGIKGINSWHMSHEGVLRDVQKLLVSMGYYSSLRGPYIDNKGYTSFTLRVTSGSLFEDSGKRVFHSVDFDQRQMVKKAIDRVGLNRSNKDIVYAYHDLKRHWDMSFERVNMLIENHNLDVKVVSSLKVTNLECIGERDCVEITVDSKDHEYLVSGLVSHNCGRVARVDSVYEFQNIYMLEAKETIDTYKRMLLQSNMTLVQEIFGQDSTMPYFGDVNNDVMKKYRQYFKNKFLWCR